MTYVRFEDLLARQPKKQKKRGFLLPTILICVLVVGMGSAGYLWYRSTRPNPVLTMVSSPYHQGTLVVGATTITFLVTGSHFTSNAAVSFLLDSASAPGGALVESDSTGAIRATLTVTSAWRPGRHVLLAKDSAGYETKVGWPMMIVAPGQAHTPGPHGAPSDDANLLIVGSLQGTSQTTRHLTIKSSPNGGQVCGDEDDGQPHQSQGTSAGLTYTETRVVTCAGSYKGEW